MSDLATLTAKQADLARRRLHIQEEIDGLVLERHEIDRAIAALAGERLVAELSELFAARPALLACVEGVS